MNRGKLIVIEGNEFSGKSTQCRWLTDAFKRHQYPVYQTQEPSHGPIGKIIRSEYLSGRRIADRRLINYLFAADRLDHITNTENGMLKYINDGYYVITDRYYMTSLPLYAQEFIDTPDYMKEMEFIMSLNETARNLLPPDITIVLKINDEEMKKRLLNRSDKIEIYDTDDVTVKTKQAYEDTIAYLRKKGDLIYEVDGCGHDYQVFGRIWSIIDPFLKGASQ